MLRVQSGQPATWQQGVPCPGQPGYPRRMKALPHHYTVRASARPESHIRLESPGLAALESAAPAEFDGPGDRWSPETLLVGAVADCLILTFRAVAQASHFTWSALDVEGEGVLDRVEGKMRFTEVRLRARLTVPAGTDEARARQLLEKAERSCLISNSLSAQVHLEPSIVTDEKAYGDSK